MGGSGNGMGGGKSRKKIVPCEELIIKTQLSSPIDDINKYVNVDDYLGIQISEDGSSCVAISKGKIVGTIFHVDLKQLISCIKSGVTFIGYVRIMRGGNCGITIMRLK